MTDWDYTKDMVMVGTGGGEMTAALVAKQVGGDSGRVGFDIHKLHLPHQFQARGEIHLKALDIVVAG